MTVELKLNLSGAYADYTEWVDITGLKRNISLDANNDPQRTLTGEIEVFGQAYTLVYMNLVDSPNLYSNSIYVKITDTSCSNLVQEYQVQTQNLKWCDNNECTLRFSMVEYNPTLDCIRETLLADNWQGEFQEYPTSGMIHPRFRYCDVMKPTAMFGVWVTFLNALDLVITSIVGPLNILLNIAGIPPITFTAFTKWGGCDRGFPAPYIRTYISNVCDKCGAAVDVSTMPIFYDTADVFAPIYTNPYYYACLLTAPVTKGVDMNGTKDYLISNQPSWTLYDLMSKIKGLWNASWYMRNGKLYMHRKDLISGLIYSSYGIDFTGSDSEHLLGHVCYEWNGQGKVRRLNMNYSLDPSDNIGNELLKRFNGEYLELSANPNYKEMREETMIDFGAPSFVLDGYDTIYDANIINAIGTVVSGFDFAGCLKTQGDTLGLAKILIHSDGTGMNDARVWQNNWSLYNCAEFADDQGGFTTVVASDLYNYNYPMSFSPCQDPISPTGNLWQYWEIEKPANDKKTNISFNFTLEYCCDYNSLDLYMRVLFQDGVTEGEIKSIEFNYSNRTITIKGELI